MPRAVPSGTIQAMGKPIVCIAGAGTAGLEALLEARAQLGDSVELVLISPDREFRYRPMSRDLPFQPAHERAVSIGDLVADVGARWLRDKVEVVRPAERSLLTRDGDQVSYDYLLLATGERSTRPLRQGYLWRRGGDPRFLDRILLEVVNGIVHSVALVVPRGARWPLPAYELALVLGWTAGRGAGATVSLLTAEPEPLAALGSLACATVMAELDAAGVEIYAGVELIDEPELPPPTMSVADVIIVPERAADQATALIGEPTDPARVRAGTGAAQKFDRLISLPVMLGPHIVGVPSDPLGFVEVNESLKVYGSDRIWAAGGCIAAALEHSALSAQQADAAIAAIAQELSGEASSGTSAAPFELTGLLLTGQRERWQAKNPLGTEEPSTRCFWWPPGRAVGRRLAERIAALDPEISESPLQDSGGVAIHVPLALGCESPGPTYGPHEVTDELRHARLLDLENRQVMAVRRHEREAAPPRSRRCR